MAARSASAFCCSKANFASICSRVYPKAGIELDGYGELNCIVGLVSPRACGGAVLDKCWEGSKGISMVGTNVFWVLWEGPGPAPVVCWLDWSRADSAAVLERVSIGAILRGKSLLDEWGHIKRGGKDGGAVDCGRS